MAERKETRDTSLFPFHRGVARSVFDIWALNPSTNMKIKEEWMRKINIPQFRLLSQRKHDLFKVLGELDIEKEGRVIRISMNPAISVGSLAFAEAETVVQAMIVEQSERLKLPIPQIEEVDFTVRDPLPDMPKPDHITGMSDEVGEHLFRLTEKAIFEKAQDPGLVLIHKLVNEFVRNGQISELEKLDHYINFTFGVGAVYFTCRNAWERVNSSST